MAAPPPGDHPPFTPPWPGLTEAETEVARRLALGASCADIAAEFEKSTKTVESQRGNVLRKLGLSGTVALARYAIRHGYVSISESPLERRDRDA